MSFWDTVSVELKKMHCGQDFLCEQTGISINTLRGWISKDVLPRVDDAYKIACCLHVSIEYLVTGKPNDVDEFRIKILDFIETLN